MASLSEQVIVFSGFRNDALKAAIAAKGGRVVSALSGLTTMLVVKPNSRTSGKVEKASWRDMKIIELDAFCEEFGFDLDCLDEPKPKPTKKSVKPGSAPTKKAKKQPTPDPEPVPEPVKKPKALAAKQVKPNKARASPQTETGSDPEDSAPVMAIESKHKPSKKCALEKPIKKASKKA